MHELPKSRLYFCERRKPPVARNLDRLVGRGPNDPEIARALDEARTFIREGWALQAIRLGWGELELFGVSTESSSGRRNWMGAAFRDGVQAVTEEAIVHVGGRRFYRATASGESVIVIWEALSG